jgi:hypothetical protein
MPRAHTVISGVVRNPRGEPVAQARVYFTGGPTAFPDIAALTDRGGKFSLSAPSGGTYNLECMAEGFAPAAVTITVEEGQEVQLEIGLKR